MARKVADLSRGELGVLADRALDLTFDIERATEKVSVLSDMPVLDIIRVLSHLAEAALGMNRRLISVETLRQVELDRTLRARIEESKS